MSSFSPPSTPDVASYDYSPERLQRMLADVITRRFQVTDVRLLLRAGADADGPVTRGLRPLHYAAYENDVASTEALIDSGARVNAADDLGYTPLHVAAKHGHVEVARTLIDRGAAVNIGYDEDEDDWRLTAVQARVKTAEEGESDKIKHKVIMTSKI
jgi:ankyrin repeat protein